MPKISVFKVLRWAALVSLVALVAACASSRPVRLSYSRQRLATQHPGQYLAPGTPDDPWGPYVREAAVRFRVPEIWIREVMRRESEGEQYQEGSLTTSSVGAMGLMQVMPGTYLMLQERYSLGIDPYDPHDNVMAGTAYIREMYDRYGSPGFLAAYNAGPERLDEYINFGTPLPSETVAYVAAIAPRLGSTIAPTGPLAAYALAAPEVSADELNRQVAGGSFEAVPHRLTAGISPPLINVAQAATIPTDESADDLNATTFDRSADDLSRRSFSPVVAKPAVPEPLMQASAPSQDDWSVQVGAFSNPSGAEAAIQQAKSLSGGVLDTGVTALSQITRGDGVVLYRAKLTGLSEATASTACHRLIEAQQPCIVVPAAAVS